MSNKSRRTNGAPPVSRTASMPGSLLNMIATVSKLRSLGEGLRHESHIMERALHEQVTMYVKKRGSVTLRRRARQFVLGFTLLNLQNLAIRQRIAGQHNGCRLMNPATIFNR
ncbi:MAG: hypothetical protein OXP71_17260 [Candidatus Poribacteria bacterium]|nr:hypothetical protein [Candidatus Poribacteria bacterium]